MFYLNRFFCLLLIVCSIIPNIGANVINDRAYSTVELPDVGIIGGKEAKPGMFPYIVSLQTNEGIPTHFCGGSLISQRYVLTAAHCVRKSRDFHVRLGVHNLMDRNETIQRFSISKVIMHPEFVKEMPGSANDIALIKLDQLVDFKIIKSGFGSTAKIELSRRFVPIDTKLTIAGWGAAEFPARRSSPFLKYANYKLMNIFECPEAYLRDNGRGSYCVETGNSTNSPFSGDSGGPCLENDDQNKISLVGIVSFLSNAKKVGPLIVWKNIVCTKISNYLDWIESVTGPLS